MALIECSRCGKKITDTAENCIHCGAPTHILDSDDKSTCITDQCISENAGESDRLPSYNSFGEDYKLELEREFLKSDVRAMKYRRRRAEISRFVLMFFGILFALFFVIKFLFEVPDEILSNTVYNKPLDKLSEHLLIAIIIYAFSCLIYAIVASIIMKISIKQYVYMKKFQKWLKEEKGIDYMPPLQKIKQKRIFDSIDLETFNL